MTFFFLSLSFYFFSLSSLCFFSRVSIYRSPLSFNSVRLPGRTGTSQSDREISLSGRLTDANRLPVPVSRVISLQFQTSRNFHGDRREAQTSGVQSMLIARCCTVCRTFRCLSVSSADGKRKRQYLYCSRKSLRSIGSLNVIIRVPMETI